MILGTGAHQEVNAEGSEASWVGIHGAWLLLLLETSSSGAPSAAHLHLQPAQETW